MADETPPLNDVRLEQMRGYAEAIRTAKHAIESVSSELVIASDYMLTLIAEVDRLRAREAAAMAIVREVAGMSVEDGIYDQPFYALMSRVHETDERWHQQLVTQARSLLAQE